MKIAVILSGCGVNDGSEIHEAVLGLLAIKEYGAEYACFAPDINQHHVINHLTGEETKETRNVLIESARIARGDIQSLSKLDMSAMDGLFVPGGFGAAKNLNKWAFSGPDGEINQEVKQVILSAVELQKPIAAICMGPTVVAKALEGSGISATLTVGTTKAASPYDIKAISEGMESIGAKSTNKSINEIGIDEVYKIVTAPCYMMETDIVGIRKNTQMVIKKLVDMIKISQPATTG